MPPGDRYAEAVVGIDERIAGEVEIEERIGRAEERHLPVIPTQQAKVVAHAEERRTEISASALDVELAQKKARLRRIGQQRTKSRALRKEFELRPRRERDRGEQQDRKQAFHAEAKSLSGKMPGSSWRS